MVDEPRKQDGEDTARIDVTEPYDLAYWTTTFRVSEKTLQEAVAAVGVKAADVRRHLSR